MTEEQGEMKWGQPKGNDARLIAGLIKKYIQLTLEQHKLELRWFTYMWIFFFQ